MHVSVIETIGALATMPTITAIDTDTLTVTLSAAQTWAITKDITFRAYGVSLIDKAIGIKLFTSNAKVDLGQVSTTIRTELTSSIVETGEINVTGTGGIGAGSGVRIKGLNKSTEEDETTITEVDGGLTDGTIVLENATLEASADDPIRVGTVVYVDGTSNEVFLTGNISVNKYPTDDQDIFLDISKFLTLGTAS